MKVYQAIHILDNAEKILNRKGRPEDIEVNHLKHYLKENRELGEAL